LVAIRSSAIAAGERLPEKIGGKYRPLRVLGRGGMSVVYEVEHELTRERLALKVLTRGAAFGRVSFARFRREARMSSLIKSDHVVRVVDADLAPELGDAPYLVMDLLRGADLATLSAGAAQAPEQVVDWLRQAARALDAAHRCGVVHRDIKPENLFCVETPSGGAQIKVLDFGIASVPTIEDTGETNTGSLLGTPTFMAPEQASGDEVGPPADEWSVAMCAFRLLSGRNYWQAENSALLLAKIIYEQVVPPSVKGFDLGPAFDAWFVRSCARDPAARWETVGVQVEALAAALGRPVEAIAVPEALEPAPLQETAETTLPELAPIEPRSHSLVATYSSAPTRSKFPLGWFVVAGIAAVGAVLLSVQGPVRATRTGDTPRPGVSASNLAPRRVPPSVEATSPPQPTLDHEAKNAEQATAPETTAPARMNAHVDGKRNLPRRAAVALPNTSAVAMERHETVNAAPHEPPSPAPPAAPAPRDPLADPE
jgi:serine/threonine-protein kinase